MKKKMNLFDVAEMFCIVCKNVIADLENDFNANGGGDTELWDTEYVPQIKKWEKPIKTIEGVIKKEKEKKIISNELFYATCELVDEIEAYEVVQHNGEGGYDETTVLGYLKSVIKKYRPFFNEE